MPRTDTLDKGLTGLKNRSPYPNDMVLNEGVTFKVRVSIAPIYVVISIHHHN